MLFNMSLNQIKRLYQRSDNVKIKKKQALLTTNVHKKFMLVRELLLLSQLTTKSNCTENSSGKENFQNFSILTKQNTSHGYKLRSKPGSVAIPKSGTQRHANSFIARAARLL